jgi:hypothetical protein
MLKTDIKLLVKGFKKGTHETKGAFTKLQTLSVNENGAEKVEEVKIYQDIPDVLNLVDKVVLCENVSEYRPEFESYYSCDNYKIINEKINESFIINRSMELKVTNVSNVINKENKKTSAVYSNKINEEGALTSIKVKLRTPTSDENLQKIKGKIIYLKDVKYSKIGFKEFYSIENTKSITIKK